MERSPVTAWSPRRPPVGGRGPAHASNRSRFSEALAGLGRLATGGEPIDALLEGGCGFVAEALSVDAVVLLVPGPDADRLVVRAATGCLSDAIGEVVACGPGTQAGSALERLATGTADVRVIWPDDAFLASHGLATSVLAVLPGPSGPLGLLGASEASARTFEPDEIAFLDAAATWLSAVLGRHLGELECERLQARLAAAGRMASLGTLANGVARELNNPLSYVTANLAFVAEEGGALAGRLEAAGAKDRELAESAREIIDAAVDARDGVEQMRELVRDLQAFASGDDSVLTPIDLTDALECSITLARSEIEHRAQFERQLARSLPPVLGNAARLGQVFLDLLVFAAHAVPEGHANEQSIRVRSFTLPGNRVAVEVSDAGVWIPAERLERLFDPGSGGELGLSACRSIVTALGGELQVTSQAGKGTTFQVLLPAVPSQGVGQDPDRAATGARRGRILVVDDEPLVGTIIARTLGGEFDVVSTGGAKEALERLARGDRFDVIFSDLMMPGMNGMELHRELGRLDAELASKMVFISGGACTEEARDFLAGPGVEWIGKPFDLAAIRGVIARRLPPT
jgi:signal transduction histidine kinase/CheY-like chemotaxis protein